MYIVVIKRRAVAAAVVAIVGSLSGLVVGGGMVGACLGPLNVTAVRCAVRGGGLPTEGSWGAIITSAIALGLLIAVARTRISRPDTIAALSGAVVGAMAYILRRPLTLEGPDFDGTWLVLPLPVDFGTMLAWAITGGIVGLAMIAVVRAVRHQQGAG